MSHEAHVHLALVRLQEPNDVLRTKAVSNRTYFLSGNQRCKADQLNTNEDATYLNVVLGAHLSDTLVHDLVDD
jgi:hypothetical protein